jgi:hypothetical protein
VIGEAARQILVKGQIETIEPGNFEIVPAASALIWEPYPDAVVYRVVLLENDTFPPVVVSDTSTKETTFLVTTPLEPGSYSLTVWVKDTDSVIVAESNNQFVVE